MPEAASYPDDKKKFFSGNEESACSIRKNWIAAAGSFLQGG